MHIETASHWNSDFFKRFVEIRTRAQGDNPWALDESEKDLRKYFAAESPFAQHNHWRCWILVEHGRVSARLGCTYPKTAPLPAFLPTGFYESLDASPAGLKLLFGEARAFGKSLGVRQLRLPMQGGFFGSYRARLPAVAEPFYGEPETLPRYLTEWDSAGFEICHRWRNYDIDVSKMVESVRQALDRFYGKDEIPGLEFEPIGARGFNTDLLRLRAMFLDSYRVMPDYHAITEQEFLHLYLPFRRLFKEELCFFVTREGRDLGFMLGFFDPLPHILRTKRNYGFLPVPLQQLLVLPHLNRPNTRLFLPYAGKTAEASSVKGLFAAMIYRVLLPLVGRIETISWQYVSETSDTLKTLRPGTFQPAAEFCLFKQEF